MSLFLTAWLVGWGFGEVFAARELLSGKPGPPDLFVAAWLAAWTVGAGAAICVWLWMAKAREVIVLQRDALTVRREVLGVGPAREYDLHHRIFESRRIHGTPTTGVSPPHQVQSSVNSDSFLDQPKGWCHNRRPVPGPSLACGVSLQRAPSRPHRCSDRTPRLAAK
jgi:hypothetical protein